MIIYYGSLRKPMQCYSLNSVRNTSVSPPTAGPDPVLAVTAQTWIPRMPCSCTSVSKGICFLWSLIYHIAYLFFPLVFNDTTQGGGTNTRFGMSSWFGHWSVISSNWAWLFHVWSEEVRQDVLNNRSPQASLIMKGFSTESPASQETPQSWAN